MAMTSFTFLTLPYYRTSYIEDILCKFFCNNVTEKLSNLTSIASTIKLKLLFKLLYLFMCLLTVLNQKIINHKQDVANGLRLTVIQPCMPITSSVSNMK